MRFKILDGLPAYGERAIEFNPNPLGSEGLVVQFLPHAGEPWVGNFLGAFGTLNEVVEHPDRTHVIVVASGEVYVIDPETRAVTERSRSAFNCSFHCNERGILIFGGDFEFVAYDQSGVRWESERISWDGFRDLACDCNTLTGESWNIDDTWISFSLDVESGKHVGGAYSENFFEPPESRGFFQRGIQSIVEFVSKKK